MRFDRRKFFDAVRKAFGSLNQMQVDGLGFLLGSFEDDPKWKDVRHIAYALATVKHETAETYHPIKEYRSRVGSKGRANQDRYWLSGYYGRGYVQLTWKKNYEKFGLADRPDDAMKPVEAFKILSVGMQVGSFTGKRLSDFIKGSTCDYKNARKVINGIDKADLIAGYAKAFEKALRASTISAAPAAIPSEKPDLSVQADDQGGLSQSADTAAGTHPVETTVTRTAGDVTVEASKTNQQDVNIPAEIDKPEPYQGVGFWQVIKRDLLAATGGNISLASLTEYAQTASGWPQWLVGIIGKIAVGALIATLAYFVFRVIHFAVDSWKKSRKIAVEAEAKTAIDRKDIVWK